MQRSQGLPPSQNQDQNQDVVQAVCNLHLKYEEYFLFNYVLNYRPIYNAIVEKLDAEFHEKSKQLKSGEFLLSPTEDNYKAEIQKFTVAYLDGRGNVDFPDKNVVIENEIEEIEESWSKIFRGLKRVPTEQAFERAIESMDDLLNAIYDYRFKQGYQAFAIGEHEKLIQFFKDNKWFAREIVGSFQDSSLQASQMIKAETFFKHYNFANFNESLNAFYKNFFEIYIEAVGIDLSHSSSQKLKELLEQTFNNEFNCSPVFLLTVLKDDCQVLAQEIHSIIEKRVEREAQRKERKAIKEQQRPRDLEREPKQQEVKEEQMQPTATVSETRKPQATATVSETRKPQVIKVKRKKQVVADERPQTQVKAKQPQSKVTVEQTSQTQHSQSATHQQPQTKVIAKLKPQASADQQSNNATARNFRDVLSANSAEIRKITESEEQKEKEQARKAQQRQINSVHQQMKQGIEDELIKQKIKQQQEQKALEEKRKQQIVAENSYKLLDRTLEEIERMVEGEEQKQKEQAIKEQQKQRAKEHQRRQEALEESNRLELAEQKRKQEIEERRRQQAIAAELKELAIEKQRRQQELQQKARLFKPAETEKTAFTEEKQMYVNDEVSPVIIVDSDDEESNLIIVDSDNEDSQVIVVDESKVIIMNTELVLQKLDVILAQDNRSRSVPDNMSSSDFLRFLDGWLPKMKEKKSYLATKITIFKDVQENDVLAHLIDQEALLEDIREIVKDLRDYAQLYKDNFSENDLTVANHAEEQINQSQSRRGNKR